MLYIYIWVINYLCSFKISTLICSNPNIILSVVFDSFRVIGVFRWRVQIHIQHTRSTVIMQIIQPFGWIPKGNGAEMCLGTLVLDLGCLTFDIGFPTLTFDSQCSALTLPVFYGLLFFFSWLYSTSTQSKLCRIWDFKKFTFSFIYQWHLRHLTTMLSTILTWRRFCK